MTFCLVPIFTFSLAFDSLVRDKAPGGVLVRLVWYDLTHYKTWLTVKLDFSNGTRAFAKYWNLIPKLKVTLVSSCSSYALQDTARVWRCDWAASTTGVSAILAREDLLSMQHTPHMFLLSCLSWPSRILR